MSKKEITEDVEYGSVDGPCLPLRRCICGAEFGDWKQILNHDSKRPWKCPDCDRELFFSAEIHVYEKENDSP